MIIAMKVGIVGLFIFFFIAPGNAFAAWNDPTCDPDNDVTGGPTGTTCYVSAPLNVSSGAQTKSGALTVQNTVNAGKLQVSNTYGGTGNVIITTSSGVALDVNQNDSTSRGLELGGSSSKSMAYISQSGTGYTLELYTGGNDKTGIYFESDGNNVTGQKIIGAATGLYLESSNSSSVGIKSKVAGTAFQVDSTRTPSIGLDIPASSSYGVKVLSSAQAGYFSSSTTGTAVKVSNSSSGEGLDVETSGQLVGNISLPTGYSSSYLDKSGVRAVSSNFGVIGYTSDITAYAAGVYGMGGATTGTGGIGVFGYSKKFYGVYGDVASTSAYYGGLFCNNSTNCADLGGATYSGYFHGQVKVDATAGAALDVTQTSSSGEGINISVPSYATAIDTNGGFIKNVGAYNGGQFYPNRKAITNPSISPGPYIVQEIEMPDDYSAPNLAFDGSSIWATVTISGASDEVVRISPQDGKFIHEATLSFYYPDQIIVLGNNVYVCRDDYDTCGVIEDIHKNSDITVDFDLEKDANVMTGNGYQLFFAGDQYIYASDPASYFEIGDLFGGGAAGVGDPLITTGIGNITDMIYADGYLWATDDSNDKLHKIDVDAETIVSSVSVGTDPKTLLFDGAYIWIGNYTGESLTRVNVTDLSTKTYPLDYKVNEIAFDGVNIWIANEAAGGGFASDSAPVTAFNIAKEQVTDSVSISQLFNVPQQYRDAEHILFDGTFIWASTEGYVYKIAPHANQGYSMQSVFKGIYMYGTDGELYCAYATSGTYLRTTSDLSYCE